MKILLQKTHGLRSNIPFLQMSTNVPPILAKTVQRALMRSTIIPAIVLLDLREKTVKRVSIV